MKEHEFAVLQKKANEELGKNKALRSVEISSVYIQFNGFEKGQKFLINRTDPYYKCENIIFHKLLEWKIARDKKLDDKVGVNNE